MARLTVPAAALGQAAGQDYVWTLEHGSLVRRVVITGLRDPLTGRVEVVQGVTPHLHYEAAHGVTPLRGRARVSFTPRETFQAWIA